MHLERWILPYYVSFALNRAGVMNNEDDWTSVSGGGQGNIPAERSISNELDFLDTLSPVPPPSDGSKVEPFMLMLVGLSGSGKTTISRKIVEIMPWKYDRVNQDELGDRTVCLRSAQQILASGKCPIIDRCHVDASQRKHFIDVATETDCPIDCIVLNYSPQECLRRCNTRQGHPTLPPHKARKVIGFQVKIGGYPNQTKNFVAFGTSMMLPHLLFACQTTSHTFKLSLCFCSIF